MDAAEVVFCQKHLKNQTKKNLYTYTGIDVQFVSFLHNEANIFIILEFIYIGLSDNIEIQHVSSNCPDSLFLQLNGGNTLVIG